MAEYSHRLSAYFLPICGIVALASVALQTDVAVRCIQMIFFIILSVIVGKKFRPVPPILLFAGVVFANLLVPNGKVLFSIRGFNVTLGALESGLSKGSMLIGLIYVSRISVGRGVRIPGAFGSLLVASFIYFEALTEGWREGGEIDGSKRKSARLNVVIPRIDRLLLDVDRRITYVNSPGDSRGGDKGKSKGLTVGVTLVAASLVPLLITGIFQRSIYPFP